MFNFTTLTVYNDIKKEGAGKNMWEVTTAPKPALRIGNTRFDRAWIESVHVKLPTEESLTSVTFDMADIIPTSGNTTARIVLYLGLSMNSQDAFYANDLVYKGKPLFIEFPVSSTDTVDQVAVRVKKIANKYLLFNMGSEKLLEVDEEAVAADPDATPDPVEASGKVTFRGVNGYQQIKKAVMQKWNPEAIPVDCCTSSGDFEDVIVGVPVVWKIASEGENVGKAVAVLDDNDKEQKLTEDGVIVALENNETAILPGIEAFGDYNWIIHNLRLPTLANTNFWAPTKNEMPVPGQKYTQFIVTMAVPRDGISGELVGARGTSVTTHVLYVAGVAALNTSVETTAADKVYKALVTVTNDASKIKKAGSAGAADTVLQAPYASV